MKGTINQWLAMLTNMTEQVALRSILHPIGDRLSSQVLGNAGLVIKAGGSALVKAGNAFYALANGKLVTKTANTDMAALSGTVVNGTFNVFCFFIDAAGTLSSAMGVAGAALKDVKFPPLPEQKAMIGFVVINPTGTGDFVGGTTALDDVTVVPNAAYVNTQAAVDPSVLLS